MSESIPDTLMEDDPGIYQALLEERDEAMQRYEQVRAENQRLVTGIRVILQASGKVCPEFETCTHDSCNASAAAHLYALGLLKGDDLREELRP